MEAAQYAALSIATNVPNAAQCVAGRRIASEIAEERMLQILARRLCHKEPEVECRPEDDVAAETRLVTIQRMATDAASVTTARVYSDMNRLRTYAGNMQTGGSDFSVQAEEAAARDK
tara:strand:- start:197 stop:547 length:351 start_codon:yes stop_codon:yes gene_type:complete